MSPSDQNSSSRLTLGPVLQTILFTLIVPGTVAILVPRWLLGGFRTPQNRLLTWFGAAVFTLGAAIYFRCAWEFAVRGLGTPAPIAPTKYLVTTALHRYIRNPMYVGVALAILGEAALFHSLHVAEYAACMLRDRSSLRLSSTRNRRCIASSANRMTNTAAPFRDGSRDFDDPGFDARSASF